MRNSLQPGPCRTKDPQGNSTTDRHTKDIRMSLRLPLLLLTVAALSAPAPAAVSTFDFEGNLNTTYGSAVMSFYNGNPFGTFGTAIVGGSPSGVLVFPAATQTQGLRVDHNTAPNGGGAYVNQYTLGFDVMFDSGPEWAAFFQSNTGNANDAELWRNGAFGIGVNGIYHGSLPPAEFARVIFAIDLTAGATSLSKYINGTLVGQQDVGSVDGRFSLDPFFELLTDNDNETCPGAISAFLYADRTLSAAEVAALGGPQAIGFVPEPTTLSLLGLGLLSLLLRRK
jgi:hypothetical protein